MTLPLRRALCLLITNAREIVVPLLDCFVIRVLCRFVVRPFSFLFFAGKAYAIRIKHGHDAPTLKAAAAAITVCLCKESIHLFSFLLFLLCGYKRSNYSYNFSAYFLNPLGSVYYDDSIRVFLGQLFVAIIDFPVVIHSLHL